jgi:L-rhamnose mutarotase
MIKLQLTLTMLLLFGYLTKNYAQQTDASSQPENKHLERYGSIIKLKPEYEERYIILHKHTFPGVLDRIRKSNIRNYTIFLLNGVLFSHFEYVGSDFEGDMTKMADEVTKDWWKLTDPMQEPFETRKEGEWWASMELLFEMDISKTAYQNAQRLAFVGKLKKGRLSQFKQCLKEIDDDYLELILSANIQNWTVYEKDGIVYFYYEYVGNALRKDVSDLQETEGYQSFSNKIESLFETLSEDNKQVWNYMREVFHTN